MLRADFQFQNWERALVAASGLLFFVAFAGYVTDYPLLTRGFTEGTVRVGSLSEKKGTVRRELSAEDLFRAIEKNAALYDNDTIVTDNESTATIQLDEGSTIQLDPNSMVRLAFSSEFSLSGISRVAKIDVVSGKVKSTVKSAPVKIVARGKPVQVVETGVEAIHAAPITPYVPPRPVPIQEITPPVVPEELDILSPAAKPVPVAQQLRPVVAPDGKTVLDTDGKPLLAPGGKFLMGPDGKTLMGPDGKALVGADGKPFTFVAQPIPNAEVSRLPDTLPSAGPSALPSAAPSTAPSAIPSAAPSMPPVAFKGITKVQVLFPKAKARLRVPDGSRDPVVDWTMKWSAKPAKVPLKVSLYRLKRNGAEISREELFTQIVQTSGKQQVTSHKIDSPGEYEWELQGPNGESLAAVGKPFVQFTVEPEFVGIHPKDPLVGGKKAGSNRVEDRVLKDFDVVLGWDPYREVEEYKVWIAASPDARKPLIEKTVSGKTSFALNKDQVFKGRMYYRVKGALTNGFVVTSPMKPFIFDFMPPLLTRPETKTVVTKSDLEASGGSVLFTWQKTNFTDDYTFELATDAGFSKIIQSETQTENFLALKAPAPGTYYWRVRSRAKAVESAPSAPSSFVISTK